MEEPPVVRQLQGVSDLSCDAQYVGEWQGSSKRPAFNVLQHQVIRSNIVNLEDVWMVEGGNRARFLLEARNVLALEPLDCDDTVEPRVASPVDFTHAACADG